MQQDSLGFWEAISLCNRLQPRGNASMCAGTKEAISFCKKAGETKSGSYLLCRQASSHSELELLSQAVELLFLRFPVRHKHCVRSRNARGLAFPIAKGLWGKEEFGKLQNQLV